MPKLVEENFPRGGAVSGDRGQKRPKAQDEDPDLFPAGLRPKKKPRVQKKSDKVVKKLKKAKQMKKADRKENAIKIKPTTDEIQVLNHKLICRDMLLLGCVKEIHDYELIISLPGGLQGTVAIPNIASAYTQLLRQFTENGESAEEELHSLKELFHVGMTVRCKVLEVASGSGGGRRRIGLSIDPADVNQGLVATALKTGMVVSGSVASVEDHVYVVDLGVKGVSAFLKKKEAKKYIEEFNEGCDLYVGSYLHCMIELGDNIDLMSGESRAVNVVVDPRKVYRTPVTLAMKPTMNSLLPGVAVDATVFKISEDGLVVKFLEYSGVIHRSHLEQSPKMMEAKQEIKAVVLFIEPLTKSITLSTLTHLVTPDLAPKQPFRGIQPKAVLEDVKVIQVDKKRGVYFRVADRMRGFATLKQLGDQEVKNLTSEFAKGSLHKCRVLGLDYADSIVQLSLKKSIVERKYTSYADFLPGSTVDCTVCTIQPQGISVKIDEYVRGFVPRIHLADVPLKNPEQRFTGGDKLKCRVLRVDPAERKMTLTCKGSLLRSKNPIITSYEQVQRHMILDGVIIKIMPAGVLVLFYNDVKGFVPKKLLSTEFIEKPEKVFFIGQIVRSQVIFINSEQKKMTLTLQLKDKKPFAAPVAQVPTDFQIGKMVKCEVKEKADDGLEVELKPSGLTGFIPKLHLSDHLSNCSLLYDIAKVGDIITDAMYLSSGASITVTCKPSLLYAGQQHTLPAGFDALTPGMILPGVVHKVMPYGVFVDMTHGAVGLCPHKFLVDRYHPNPLSLYQLGQSVLGKITELDQEKRRILVSLRLADCYHGDLDVGLDLLACYLNEYNKVMAAMRHFKGVKSRLSTLTAGQVVMATVTDVNDHGVLCELEGGIKGFATVMHTEGLHCKRGEKYEGVVLHTDLKDGSVELMLSRDWVATVKTRKENKFSKARVGQVIKSEVVVVRDDFILVVLKGHAAGKLAYLPAKRVVNDPMEKHHYLVGQVNPVIVKRDIDDTILATLEIHEAHAKPGSALTVAASKESKDATKLLVGTVATAVVKSVLNHQMNITIGALNGRVHISNVADDVEEGTNPLDAYKAEDKIKVKVIGFREVNNKSYQAVSQADKVQLAECSLKPSDLKSADKSSIKKEYSKGQKVLAYVNCMRHRSLMMNITPTVRGRVHVLQLSDKLQVLKNPERHFQPGKCYHATILSVDKAGEQLELSLKGDGASFEAGSIHPGLVLSAGPLGMRLQLSHKDFATVNLTDVQNEFSDSPMAPYKVGQFVRGCVIHKDGDHHVLSLRPSRLLGDLSRVKDPEITEIDQVVEGSLLRGFIYAANDKGVRVSLGRKISAWVPLPQVSAYFVKNPEEAFFKGRVVTAKVMGNDGEDIELSLLRRDTGVSDDVAPKEFRLSLRRGSDAAPKKKAKKKKEQVDEKPKSKKRKAEQKEEKAKKRKVLDAHEIDSGVDTDSDAEVKMIDSPASSAAIPRLQLPAAFSWDTSFNLPVKSAAQDSDSDESDPEDTEKAKPKKKTRAEKLQELRDEEKKIAKREQELMDTDRLPETTDDFDRLVLTSPDSSMVWLRYMAHHLETTEIEKARAVAERALKTISFREEQEKLNVWVAYLNLENMYGSHESLIELFDRALKHNEPLNVFQQLINIYITSGKIDSADRLYNQMARRFSLNKDVWINFGLFYFKHADKPEMARKLMQRSLKSLDRRDHVEVISKFSQMEFKYGEAERGKTMFENLLSSYSKRTDLWMVYIDMLIKIADLESTRQIFERAITLNLSAKKMKSIFKKYLDFETKYGDDSKVTEVKQKAIAYVESKSVME